MPLNLFTELGKDLMGFWTASVISFQLKSVASLAFPGKGGARGTSHLGSPFTRENEYGVADFGPIEGGLFNEDPANNLGDQFELEEPEQFRAAPEWSVRSMDTPSQLPWVSHAGSTGIDS